MEDPNIIRILNDPKSRIRTRKKSFRINISTTLILSLDPCSDADSGILIWEGPNLNFFGRGVSAARKFFMIDFFILKT
jgi:hypothetical protein